jgi:hypothetical protein
MRFIIISGCCFAKTNTNLGMSLYIVKSASVIWGKKYEKVKRKKGEMQDKRE